MYGNYQRPGSGFQVTSNGNGNFFYQGQAQVNPGQPPNQFFDIFNHLNQNPSYFQQQQQFPARPHIQPPNFYYQNQPPPQTNNSQFYPPMPQYPQQQPQQPYSSMQNQYPSNLRQQQTIPNQYPQQQNQNKPQTQNNSIKIPSELNAPANPLESKLSSLSSIYKPYRSPFSISADIKTPENKHINQNQPNSIDSFAYIPPPFSFDPKSDNCCSFLKTGRQPCTGDYFICYTCQQKILETGNNNNNKSQSVIVCGNCAKKCHAGHALQIVNPYVQAYCDCGSGNIDRNVGPNSHSICKCKIVPSNITSCIMYTNNNMKNQYPLFCCETCSSNSKNRCIVCSACASICHSGHKLNPAGVGNVCGCNNGKTCKLYEPTKVKK